MTPRSPVLFSSVVVLALAGAAAAQCPESGGLFTGSALGMSLGERTGFDSGEYYLKRVGFRTTPPTLWSTPSGPSFRIGDAMRQCGVTGALPDIDAMSSGFDWIQADAQGRVDIPINQWAYLRVSVSSTSSGRRGSRIATEAADPTGAGGDVFSYILPGSFLVPDVVGVVERSQDSSEIDLGGSRVAPPEIDALDDFTPFYDRRGGWPQVMPQNPRFYFSVSTASIPRVPSAWWGSSGRSGAHVFVMEWLGTAGWTCPRVWRTASELGLASNEDLDALSIDLERRHMLFSTKTASRNEILYLPIVGPPSAAVPVPHTDQGGMPVSEAIGVSGTDDVDAICAGDPSVRGTNGQPRSPSFLGYGAFRPLFTNPPALAGSAYRHAILFGEYIDTHMVGWPSAGPGAGVAALFLTPRPEVPISFAILVDVQARNPASVFCCGDPRSVRIQIPNALSLSYATLGLRWVATDAMGTELVEAHALRITL